jgi:hypothetical protein
MVEDDDSKVTPEAVIHSSYTNDHGLVGGNIPAGQPCPFLDACKLRFERCPTPENLKTVPFSCAAARLHALVKSTGGTPLMRDFLDNPPKD